jgi:hypothetical protein
MLGVGKLPRERNITLLFNSRKPVIPEDIDQIISLGVRKGVGRGGGNTMLQIRSFPTLFGMGCHTRKEAGT